MVSQKTTDDRETDRRKLLAGYLYDCSKMMYGSVAVGGLSPLLTGDPLQAVHQVCLVSGVACGASLAYLANYIMKFKIMDAFLLFNVMALGMTIAFGIFLKSKKGQKWLREL